MARERDVWHESLPLRRDEPGWTEFEMRVLGRLPSCPPQAELMDLSLGEAAPDRAAWLSEHLPQCRYCTRKLQDYQAILAAQPKPPPWAVEELPDDGSADEVFEQTNFMWDGNWTKLRASLRPYLPLVLAHVGLEAGRANALLAYVDLRAREIVNQTRRFREVFPEWVNAFASESAGPQREFTRPDWEALIEREVIAEVLGDQALDKQVTSLDRLRQLGVSNDVEQTIRKKMEELFEVA